MNQATRRTLAIAGIAVSIATFTSVANAGMLEDRLANTRAEAQQTKNEINVIDRRQQAVVRQVTKLNRRINALERPLHKLEAEVDGLEYQIERRKQRIEDLKAERKRQEKEIVRLGKELDAARDLLASRVVTAYKTGDTGMLEQLAGAGSLEELFRREEALAQVVGLDDRVIDKIHDAERKVRVKRARNFTIRRQIADSIKELDSERATVDRKRAEAQRRRDEVAAVKANRDAVLRKLKDREADLGSHLDDLEEDARVLREVIKNGTATYHGQIGGLSASGFIWPVSGPVVSPFGPRWGRMHEGIDIAIGAGNPIAAAASGVVTYAGWMSGYGNMVIIQHAGNLATGYAHQSQIATSVGQLVKQGQVIGFVGCTGHCFGDHLHFEVYVDGAPHDPLQYLT
ncbi:MAG: peptidoglycan DD-metalloendopeptidase family protein [Thermoleophilia bacterium]|nr:peptidoglycan DD-metalloendopeptidase family protein [Thermoleophilia bacterium]